MDEKREKFLFHPGTSKTNKRDRGNQQSLDDF